LKKNIEVKTNPTRTWQAIYNIYNKKYIYICMEINYNKNEKTMHGFKINNCVTFIFKTWKINHEIQNSNSKYILIIFFVLKYGIKTG